MSIRKRVLVDKKSIQIKGKSRNLLGFRRNRYLLRDLKVNSLTFIMTPFTIIASYISRILSDNIKWRFRILEVRDHLDSAKTLKRSSAKMNSLGTQWFNKQRKEIYRKCRKDELCGNIHIFCHLILQMLW